MDAQERVNVQADGMASGAALLVRPDVGVLALTGDDRTDFLQRMTTNNIAVLRAGQAAVTVLTSATARIVQVFTVICRADELLLVAAPGQAGALERELRGKIFFMDKVVVSNRSAEYAVMRVVGPQAQGALAAASLPAPTGNDQWLAQDGLLVLAQQRFEAPGYLMLVPSERAEIVRRSLSNAGAVEIDAPMYAARLVQLGRPAPGTELTADFTPLEAGLAWACAENKGCYTGQEIIARQITYDKVTRALVQLRSNAPLAAGSALTVDGRDAGVVTSVAADETGAPIALAIVKRPYSEPGTRLRAGEREAEVVEPGER